MLVSQLAPSSVADSADRALARRHTLEIQDMLRSDEFQPRDAFLTRNLTTDKEPLLAAVTLLEGLQYRFCIGMSAETPPLIVRFFDNSGAAVPARVEGRAPYYLVAVTAKRTGRYYLQIGLTGDDPVWICLSYAFRKAAD